MQDSLSFEQCRELVLEDEEMEEEVPWEVYEKGGEDDDDNKDVLAMGMGREDVAAAGAVASATDVAAVEPVEET